MKGIRILIIPLLFLTCCKIAFGQVLDVNGDGVVGPHEAIAVHEQWKGPASEADDHDHLGQTWRPEGEGTPLSIRGNFPNRTIAIPLPKDGKQIFSSIPSAPLILDNTVSNGSDLLLGGSLGIIRAVEESDSTLVLRTNRDVAIFLNEDGTGPTGVFALRAENGFPYFSVSEAGDLDLFRNATIGGNLEVTGTINGMNIKRTYAKGTEETPVHAISGERPMHVMSGRVTLDEQGEAIVELPSADSWIQESFLYQLTPVGGASPNLHVADEIHEGRFRIAGGTPGLTVCWQLTGISE